MAQSDMNRATTFRPFRPEDYAALADLLTRLRPAEPVSEEHLRRFDPEVLPEVFGRDDVFHRSRILRDAISWPNT